MCSIAASKWITKPWVRYTRAWHKLGHGVALMSSTAYQLLSYRYAPPSTRCDLLSWILLLPISPELVFRHDVMEWLFVNILVLNRYNGPNIPGREAKSPDPSDPCWRSCCVLGAILFDVM